MYALNHYTGSLCSSWRRDVYAALDAASGGRKRLSLQEELLAASRIGVVAVQAANRAASTERRHPSPSEKYLACVAAQKQREQGLLRRQKLEQGGKPAIFRRETVKTMASRKSNTRLLPAMPA